MGPGPVKAIERACVLVPGLGNILEVTEPELTRTDDSISGFMKSEVAACSV